LTGFSLKPSLSKLPGLGADETKSPLFASKSDFDLKHSFLFKNECYVLFELLGGVN
jgi:hypothetical protein